jgi:hypothetical protein
MLGNGLSLKPIKEQIILGSGHVRNEWTHDKGQRGELTMKGMQGGE